MYRSVTRTEEWPMMRLTASSDAPLFAIREQAVCLRQWNVRCSGSPANLHASLIRRDKYSGLTASPEELVITCGEGLLACRSTSRAASVSGKMRRFPFLVL